MLIGFLLMVVGFMCTITGQKKARDEWYEEMERREKKKEEERNRKTINMSM